MERCCQTPWGSLFGDSTSHVHARMPRQCPSFTGQTHWDKAELGRWEAALLNGVKTSKRKTSSLGAVFGSQTPGNSSSGSPTEPRAHSSVRYSYPLPLFSRYSKGSGPASWYSPSHRANS
eukprot:2780472-Pyramimonas_sp.AAC.1